VRAIARVVVTEFGSICLLGSATTAGLICAEIKELISGDSVYLELTASITSAEGSGIIYYDSFGTTLYKTPKGTIWKDSPKNPCTKYDKRAIQSRPSTSLQA
jgi:hypothetical protein